MNRMQLALGALAMIAATPLLAAPKGDEPVAVPLSIRQGIDFVYVDPKLSTVARRHQRPRNWLGRVFSGDNSTRAGAPNTLFAQLSEGMQRYQARWGRLPQGKIAFGATLKPGSTGKRVGELRTRLGLSPGGDYDRSLADAISAYQQAHGLGTADGIAGKATLASLNRGANYYVRKIAINMERAYRLPARRAFDRYIVVDSGAAEVYLFDHDRMADQMRAVVGAPATKTPMMAVLMKDAKARPYWNVPPELIRSLTAKRIGESGLSYLEDFHYEVLADWTANATTIDPQSVNWKAIETGKQAPTIRVRQLPGPWNSMGEMKFEMPNDFGIYLHDTPHKELFDQADRWVSNGCVRLQDYRRFAGWVFGTPPQPTSPVEQRFELQPPVPVYMTYLTVAPGPNGVTFRPDPYGFDDQAMSQMFGSTARIK